MSTLTDALERIFKWLRANYPKAASSLQPGLSYEEIEAKLADLPFRLPQEVYDLYQWRNGSGKDVEAELFYEYRFISLEEAVELSKSIGTKYLLDGYFPFGWFPLFELAGEYLAVIGAESKIDSSPIVSFFEAEFVGDANFDESIAYTNLTSMMLTIAECYETNVYALNLEIENYELDRVKEKKIRFKYNPELLYLIDERDLKEYLQTSQEFKRSDGSILKSFYNPYSKLVKETWLEDSKKNLTEQTYYLGRQIIKKITYIENSEDFQSYVSEERWYASYDKYEEITVLVDRKNSKTIKRRYLDGVLKKEQEKIQPLPNPIIGIIIFVATIFYNIIALFIAPRLGSLIAVIKRLMRR